MQANHPTTLGITRRLTTLLATAGLLASIATIGTAAHAQTLDSPLHIVVGYAPGGATDRVARIVGEKLGARLGVPVIVDNKPGAGGNTGTDQASKAQPDGYTFLLSVNAPLVCAPSCRAR